jgi:hypothetical protein
MFVEGTSECFQDCQKTREQGPVPLPPSYERPWAPACRVVNRFGFGLIANRLVPVSEKKLIGSYY